MSHGKMPSPDDPDYGLSYNLRAPIGLPEPTIEVLHFRKPRPADLVAIGGMPCKRGLMDRVTDLEVLPDRMLALMMRLTGVATPALARMDMTDFAFLSEMLLGSFIPVPKEGQEHPLLQPMAEAPSSN